MHQSVNSIMKYRNTDFLIVADQGFIDYKKRRFYTEVLCEGNNLLLEPLEDCGLSAARNAIVLNAKMNNCDYVVISADSIEFTDSYDFATIIDAMKFYKLDLMGFDLKDRIPWEFNLNFVEGEHFELSKTTNSHKYRDIEVKECEICRNFFIASTDSLLDVKWDDNLKMREHEDFFWRYKQKGYKCGWTSNVVGNYIGVKEKEYRKKRNYEMSRGLQVLKEKYNMKIVQYSKLPTASAPYNIFKCLKKYTDLDIRLVQMRTNYSDGRNFPGDLLLDSPEGQKAIKEADIIHIHNN